MDRGQGTGGHGVGDRGQGPWGRGQGAGDGGLSEVSEDQPW